MSERADRFEERDREEQEDYAGTTTSVGEMLDDETPGTGDPAGTDNLELSEQEEPR